MASSYITDKEIEASWKGLLGGVLMTIILGFMMFKASPLGKYADCTQYTQKIECFRQFLDK